MGLQDRDYAGSGRAQWGGGGLGMGMGRERFGPRGPRTWTVNTWIIVICVAVFVIDNLIAASTGGVMADMGRAFDANATPEQRSRAVLVESEFAPSRTMRGASARPLLDPETRRVVGEQRYALMTPLGAVMHFSTARGLFGLEVWRFAGFQFLHADITHLVFNMIGLFFFGPIVESFLGRKRFLTYYLLTGACGAVLYLLLNLVGQIDALNNVVPGALSGDIFSPLIGASAGVFGVLMAAAFVAPNASVLFMFIIPMRMRTLIYLLLALAVYVVLTRGANAGGEAAHLGGAIAGFMLIRRPHTLSKVAEFFTFWGRRDGGGGAKKPKPVRPPKPPRNAPDEAEVDRILTKVTDEGLHSLTDRERKILKRATEAKRR